MWVPCCMGTAAACGCGKSLAEIKSFCTCPPKHNKAKQSSADEVFELSKRVKVLESQVARIQSREASNDT